MSSINRRKDASAKQTKVKECRAKRCETRDKPTEAKQGGRGARDQKRAEKPRTQFKWWSDLVEQGYGWQTNDGCGVRGAWERSPGTPELEGLIPFDPRLDDHHPFLQKQTSSASYEPAPIFCRDITRVM